MAPMTAPRMGVPPKIWAVEKPMSTGRKVKPAFDAMLIMAARSAIWG